MQVTDLRTEYQKNPLGLDTAKPRFSWKMESDRTDTMQTAYQVQVTLDDQMVWDSGRKESDQSYLVHQLVHYKCGTCHVTRILHKRDEEV